MDAASPAPRHARLDDRSLDQLFRAARTRKAWSSRPIPRGALKELYELVSLGPTSMNCTPARFVFVESAAAKARLAPHLPGSNRDAMIAAPVCAIIAYDLEFRHQLGRLFPHNPGVADLFEDRALARTTAFRNGSLQGAYLILAARALGLDAGPMSGFDAKGVTSEFFPGGQVEANFLCNLGYGTDELLFERQPRLPFDEAAAII